MASNNLLLIFMERNLYLQNQTEVMVRAAFKFWFVLCTCALKSVFFLCLKWLLLLPFKSEVKKCAEMLTAWKHSVLFNRAGTRAVFWDVFCEDLPVCEGARGRPCPLGSGSPWGTAGDAAPDSQTTVTWPRSQSIILIGFPFRAGADLSVLEWVVNETTHLFFSFSQLQGLGCTESHWTCRRLL